MKTKQVIILMLLILPVYSQAKIGRYYRYYNFLYGESFSFNYTPVHRFSFLFDQKIATCTKNIPYFGGALTFGFNNDIREVGLKGLVNPLKRNLYISRKAVLFPFLSAQINLKNYKFEGSSSRDFNTKLGIGFNSVIFSNSRIAMRTALELGIALSDQQKSNRTVEFIELTIGFGIKSILKKCKGIKKEI